jgi:hypothetical protein
MHPFSRATTLLQAITPDNSMPETKSRRHRPGTITKAAAARQFHSDINLP